MNWYKQAQNKWSWGNFTATFTPTIIAGLLALNHFGLLDLQKAYAQNPQQVIQQAEQVQAEQIQQVQPQAVETVEQVQETGVPTEPRLSGQLNDTLSGMVTEHEGHRSKVYRDSKGIPTIGIGFNLQRGDASQKLSEIGVDINDVLKGKELTDQQINTLFEADLISAVDDARKFLPNFDKQPEMVKNIVTDMSFNLGLTRLSVFKEFQKALLKGDYQKAADEMIDSKWYGEVGNRSKKLVSIMRGI